MKIADVSRGFTIAGSSIGEEVSIRLTNGTIEFVLLNEIHPFGVEGFQLSLGTKPLTFYPFSNIIKITKITPLE